MLITGSNINSPVRFHLQLSNLFFFFFNFFHILIKHTQDWQRATKDKLHFYWVFIRRADAEDGCFIQSDWFLELRDRRRDERVHSKSSKRIYYFCMDPRSRFVFRQPLDNLRQRLCYLRIMERPFQKLAFLASTCASSIKCSRWFARWVGTRSNARILAVFAVRSSDFRLVVSHYTFTNIHT